MQTDIEIDSNDVISGELAYIVDKTVWDEGTWPGDEGAGNFMALKFEADEGATVVVELVGGQHGPKTLDSDMIAIFKITDVEQTIKVTASKEGMSTTVKEYSLEDLILESGR